MKREEDETALVIITQDLVCNFDGDDDCNDVARVYTLPTRRVYPAFNFLMLMSTTPIVMLGRLAPTCDQIKPGPSCQSVERRGPFLGAKGKDFSQSKMRDPSCCLWEFSPRWAYTNVYTC